MEVAEAVGLPVDELHFVVETFGNAVVASEAPHKPLGEAADRRGVTPHHRPGRDSSPPRNARIVADRFHVIRLINHHFLACWLGKWSRDPILKTGHFYLAQSRTFRFGLDRRLDRRCRSHVSCPVQGGQAGS